jgi:hypothetical protein
MVLGLLALGMGLGLGASSVGALPSMPAGAVESPTPPRPDEAIIAPDMEAAERLMTLGERSLERQAPADAEAAFRGALAIVEAAVGPTDDPVAFGLAR